MKIPSLVVAAFAAALPACSSASSEPTSSTDEQLTAKKPIPVVLQYAGDYDGEGRHIDYLVLGRDGRWTGSIDGHTKSGVYYGPSAPPSGGAVKVAVITRGLSFTVDVASWETHQKLVAHFGGHDETLTASWENGGETMCDETGGTWTDDDADPATGLSCICPARKSYIPSLGGCVR